MANAILNPTQSAGCCLRTESAAGVPPREASRLVACLFAAGLAAGLAFPTPAVLAADTVSAPVVAVERDDLSFRLPVDAGAVKPFDERRIAVLSPNIRAKAGGTVVQVTNSDDYPYGSPYGGTLRDAVNYVNGNCFYGPFTIGFAIPDPPAPIALGAGLPPITCAGTLVDGFSQTGSSPNTQSFGSNAVIKISLDGTLVPVFDTYRSGLTINTDDVEVRGLAIYKMPSHGIETMCGGQRSVFQGNFLGTNPGGAAGLGNGGYGISAGDAECGGVDDGLLIGGTAYSARNTIVNNTSGGIYLFRGGAIAPNRVLRNDVGVSPSQSGVGNGGPGLVLEGETGTVIGSLTDANDLNQFFANNGPGVKVIPGPLGEGGGHQFGINYTGNNTAGIGFDIDGDGATANDPGDSAPPQNYPELTTVTFNTATNAMRVIGNLPTANTGPFTVLLFGHQIASDYEAGNYLGQFSVPDATTAFDQTLSMTQSPVFYAGITANATSAVAGSQSSEISGSKISPYVGQTPASLDFGGVAVGATSNRTVTVSSATAFNILSSSTPPAGYSVDVSSCAPSAAATCNIVVTFAPTAAGTSAGNLDFESNSAGLNRIAVTAVGMSPPGIAMGFSPATVPVSASSTLTITLTNPDSLDITGAAFTNTYTTSGLVNAASPGGSTSCASGIVTATAGANSVALGGATIPAGSSCTVTVSVTSATAGSYLNTIAAGAVTTANAGSNAASASATLAVTAPAVSLAPATLAFGSIRRGTSSTAQTVTLTNSGTGLLTFSGPPTASTGFSTSTTATPCTTTVAPSASCTIDVVFAPTTLGTVSGTLAFASNAPGSPHVVSLGGTGVEPAVSLSPTSLTFAAQALGTTSAAQGVTLSNTGTAPLAISGIVASGDFAQGNTCGASVAAGASCTISVTFAPTVSGTRTGAVTINDDAPGSPHSVALTGGGSSLIPPAVALQFPTGAVIQGNPALFKVTLTNANPAPMGISAFPVSLPAGLTIASPANAQVIAPCTGSLSAIAGDVSFGVGSLALPTTGACSLVVDVASPTPGTYTVTVPAGAVLGTIAAASASNTAAASASLTVNPTPVPVVTLSATALAFGSQVQGTTSGAQVLTITNSGTANLDFAATPFAVTGDFAVTGSSCPTSLSPTVSCTVSITFTPTAVGPRSGQLAIATNAASSPNLVGLTGTGAPIPVPNVSLSATALAFAAQVVGTTSASQGVTLTNTGTATLGITSVVSSAGDFGMSTSCAASLPAGASCTITVTFSPLVVGARTGSVTITDNAAGSPRTISLSGSGVPPPFPNAEVTPSSLAFPSQTAGTFSAALQVTVKNTGGAPLAILAVEVIGAGFSAQNACPPTLGSGSTCTVGVVFAPGLAGSYAASLRFVTNAASAVVVVGLSGSATPAPLGQLASTPASLAFADQVVGTTSAPQAFTVTNAGSAIASISRIAVTGDFAIEGSCVDLRPGESCAFRATFTPADVGLRSGQVVFASDAANSSFAVDLGGRGVPVPAPRVSLSASGLGFGNTLVGSGASRAVTVTNSGAADLVLGAVTVTGDFHIANGCAGTLAPGLSCRIDVSFQPTIPGQRGGQVSIASNAESSPDLVSLAGVGCRFALTGRSFALVCAP